MNKLFITLSIMMGVVVLSSNYLVQFPINYFGLNEILTYGAFSYPIAFLITDLANRSYGKLLARQIVYLGFLIGIIFTLLFSTDFADLISVRIAIGSGVAFITAQLLDIQIFDRLRKKEWFVAPLTSSLIGSTVDTFLFFSISFYATGVPWVTLSLGDLAVKVLVALIMLIPFRMLLKIIKPIKVSNIFDENKNDPILKTKLFNQDLDNPIGIAAGFDKNAEVYNPLFKLGFGFVEVGTVTPLKQYGNEKPRVFRLVEDQALINRLGFNNHGSDTILNRIKSNKKLGVLGVNVGPNKDSNDRLNDYLIGLEKFSEVADYITINISSPNTENLRNFHDENKLKDLLTSISEKKKQLKTEIPVAVKISPDINENQIDLISEILLENEISAIIISNTSEACRETLQNIQRHQKGGLSGKPIEKKSNLLISKFYNLIKGKIKIIGVGGVDSGKAAYDKFLLGADYVQLYTGMVFQGPNIAGMIKKDLKELLIRDGVKNFTEIVGNKTVS